MRLSLWKKTGLGITDAPLSEIVLAKIKKEFPEECHALKYITISLPTHHSRNAMFDSMNELLAIINCAKQYNLNKYEFEEACKSFISSQFPEKQSLCPSIKNYKEKRPRRVRELLPEPKIGQVLWRKDSRRKGSCKIIKLDTQRTTVYWHETNRHTTILTSNIRNPFLFSQIKV